MLWTKGGDIHAKALKLGTAFYLLHAAAYLHAAGASAHLMGRVLRLQTLSGSW